MTSVSTIAFENVSKWFRAPGRKRPHDDVLALDGLTFHVSEGEAVGIVGPSGCGKSTTLKLIAGLALPEAGEVQVDGKSVREPNRSIGFMLQKDLLMPWKTVLFDAHGN